MSGRSHPRPLPRDGAARRPALRRLGEGLVCVGLLVGAGVAAPGSPADAFPAVGLRPGTLWALGTPVSPPTSGRLAVSGADVDVLATSFDALDRGRRILWTVPLEGVERRVVVRGWIDFDADGAFGAGEASSEVAVAPGATGATLTWTVPADVAAGPSSLLLRLAPGPEDATGGRMVPLDVEEHPLTVRQGTPLLAVSANRDPASASTPAVGDRLTYTIRVTNQSATQFAPAPTLAATLAGSLAVVPASDGGASGRAGAASPGTATGPGRPGSSGNAGTPEDATTPGPPEDAASPRTTATSGATASPADTMSWVLPDIPPGSSRSVRLVARVVEAGGEADTLVQVTTPVGCRTAGRAEQCTDTAAFPAPVARLDVEAAAPARVQLLSSAQRTVTVRNVGDGPVTGLLVTDMLPAGASFEAMTSGPDPSDPTAEVLTWALPDAVEPGGSVALVFTVTYGPQIRAGETATERVEADSDQGCAVSSGSSCRVSVRTRLVSRPDVPAGTEPPARGT